MTEINALEGRITAALDRIRRGLDGIAAAGAGPAEPAPEGDAARVQELEQRLAEERTVTAQLEERVRALKDRQDTRVAALEAEVQEARARLGRMDADLQALRESNAQLRELTAQLRAAATVAEPELVNRAVLAELEALRATRDADRAEVEAVLAELRPIIGEAS